MQCVLRSNIGCGIFSRQLCGYVGESRVKMKVEERRNGKEVKW